MLNQNHLLKPFQVKRISFILLYFNSNDYYSFQKQKIKCLASADICPHIQWTFVHHNAAGCFSWQFIGTHASFDTTHQDWICDENSLCD